MVFSHFSCNFSYVEETFVKIVFSPLVHFVIQLISLHSFGKSFCFLNMVFILLQAVFRTVVIQTDDPYQLKSSQVTNIRKVIYQCSVALLNSQSSLLLSSYSVFAETRLKKYVSKLLSEEK